ncbi:hypothetical protein AZI86_05080 [Bdellovibrio bacteriovorus]|uniref:Uncharacterized protein n=1 Tax=Bdellovibrio bacteriovorus TaxID=959 RepID=A0A150WQ19_BDEBC|nr:cell wall hydrolase [Bdellovibrio bacteriovorus]KYG66424.1 hypothetical protein AZI86_05080 [Bdellovibrio bacteriovorus]
MTSASEKKYVKSFGYFLILLLSFGLISGGQVFAAKTKSQLVFIEPKLERTVPVYAVDKNGNAGEEITSLYPGDFATLKEMRTMKDGKKWFIIKGKDQKGKDIEFALDPQSLDHDPGNPENSKIFVAAQNARKIKKTGEGDSIATATPGDDDHITCLINESCKPINPGEDIEVDEAVLALTSEGESKLKWRNYYKNKEGRWINAEETSRVSDFYSSMDEGDPNCEANKPKDQEQELLDVAAASADVGSEQQLELIMKNVGDCHKNMDGKYHDRIVESVATKKLAVMYKERKMEDGSIQIVHATRADWVAIDVLARTLYGEMASCFKKGKQYPETVAKVILNRVDFKNQTNLGSRFIASDGDESNLDYRNDITNAAFKSYQFSVWNREDPARRMAMCPPSSADKPFWKGSLPGAEEQQIWKDAVRIASKAVLQGETFRKKTKDLTALYYTSNMQLSKKDYKEVPNGSIGGKKLPMSRCIQLWKEKKLAASHPDYGIFHPFFEQALLPIAGN